MVERYFLLLCSIVFLAETSLIAAEDDILKRNSELQSILNRHLKDYDKLKIKHSGFDKYEEKDLLNGLNHIRSNVKPSAANMIELKWSDGLANLAKQWGDTCPSEEQFGPKDCLELYSQNVYKANKFDVSYVLVDWDSESKSYNFDSNSCKDVCKNYKMSVRAEFYSVGCSRSECSPGSNNYTFVCIFYPPVKDEDLLPYKKGPTCSSCPNNEICDRIDKYCVKTHRYVPLDQLSECSGIALPTNPSVNLFENDDDDDYNYKYSPEEEKDEDFSIGSKPLSSVSLIIFSLIEVLAIILN